MSLTSKPVILVIPNTSEALLRGTEASPSFGPGIEAVLYQLSTTMDSPSSIYKMETDEFNQA